VQTYVTVYTDPQVKDIVFTATEDNVPDVVHRHAGVSNTSNFFKLQNKGYTVQLETPGYRITGMEQLYQTNRPVTNITDTSFHVDLSGNTVYASGPSYRVSLEEVPAAVTVQYDANGGVFDAGFTAGIEVERGTQIKLPFQFQSGILLDGYYFNGWRVQGEEALLRPGTMVTLEEDTVFELLGK